MFFYFHMEHVVWRGNWTSYQFSNIHIINNNQYLVNGLNLTYEAKGFFADKELI